MPLFKSTAASFPNGVTNARLEGTMATSGIPDPTYAHVDSDDFNTFTATTFTVTTVGAGTTALTPVDGGAVLLTTTAGATDSIFVQRTVASFALSPTKQTFYKINIALSDVTLDTVICGLIQTTTTPLTVVNGVYLLKASGAATWTLNVTIASVTTSVPFPVTAVMTNGVPMELGFMVSNSGDVAGFFNPLTGTQVILNAIASTTQARGRIAQIIAPTLPLQATVLNPTFGIQNGAAAVKTMTVDYFVVSNER
jgi:hypothetical protein